MGRALEARGIPVLAAERGYTETHQIIANVRSFGGGLDVAHRLAEANLITNKNLIPGDTPADWDRPSGLRIGTIEVTRLGLIEADMETVADFFKRVLVDGEATEAVRGDVEAFRLPRQLVYYNFGNGWPSA